MRVPIIYQDENIVVVDKPVGLSTHAGEEHDPGAIDLVGILKAQLGVDYLGTHQRLDRETSGVILFSLRREANAALARAFFGREVGKTYIAIVHGAFRPDEIARNFRPPVPPRPLQPAPQFDRGGLQRGPIRGGPPLRGPVPPFRGRPFPAQERGRFPQQAMRPAPPPEFKSHAYKVQVQDGTLTVDLPLAPAPEAGRMLVPLRWDKQGQEATTQFRVLATSPDGRYSLLQVNALTGRTHQIRVHLAHLGHAVVGDAVYGPQTKPAPRLMLHALELTMPELVLANANGLESGQADAPIADFRLQIADYEGDAGEPNGAQADTLAAPADGQTRLDEQRFAPTDGEVGRNEHDEATLAAALMSGGATPVASPSNDGEVDEAAGATLVASRDYDEEQAGGSEAMTATPLAEEDGATQNSALKTQNSMMTFRAEPPTIFQRVVTGLPELDVASRLAVPPAPVPQMPGRFAQQQTLEIDRLTTDDRDALVALFALARARRAAFEGDAESNIYRLVNAAADGLPSITVDRYAEVLVLSLYQNTATAIEQMLVETLVEAMGAEYSVYLKRRPRTAANLDEATTAMAAPPTPAYGPRRPEITAREGGLNYIIRPIDGLSVGIFADMRETRRRVRAWARGRTVFNTFAYTCGFGLAASVGGAARVVNLDLSRRYLEWGQENYAANGLIAGDRDFIFGDAVDWFHRYHKRGERFDMVILDPPSFSTAKTTGAKDSFSVEQDYGMLAEVAARIVNPGGILLACTNHAGINRRSFREMTLGGAARVGRIATVLGYFREPVLDFPAAGREEGYLKVLALELRDDPNFRPPPKPKRERRQ